MFVTPNICIRVRCNEQRCYIVPKLPHLCRILMKCTWSVTTTGNLGIFMINHSNILDYVRYNEHMCDSKPCVRYNEHSRKLSLLNTSMIVRQSSLFLEMVLEIVATNNVVFSQSSGIRGICVIVQSLEQFCLCSLQRTYVLHLAMCSL
jgi:hypothetical protein